MSIWSFAASPSSPGVHMRHNGYARAVFLDGSVRELDSEALRRIGFTSAINDKLDIISLN